MMQTGARSLTDRRLIAAYHEANLLDEAGLAAISPLYFELSEVETRYRDEEPFREGGSKLVTKVYDSRTKKWLAMARPRDEIAPEHLDRFVHEAWLTSRLVHPNIINIYDVGIDSDGRPFFTMDLKSGHTLASKINPEIIGPDSSDDDRELLEVFMKVCDAIAYAHSKGILHLDIKPANVQVDRFGEVLVCDWELGRDNNEEENEDTPISSRPGIGGATLFGEIKGTPGFMAPEQATPDQAKDERTDVFALGCILYSILTRSPVFSGSTAEEILQQTSTGKIVPPATRFPERRVPPGLEAVAMKALAHDPSHRYSSVSELRQEVSRYLGGFTTTAENPGFAREIASFIGRNQLASAVSLLALIALTILSVLSVQGIQRQHRKVEAEKVRAEQLQSKARTLEETTEILASKIEAEEQSRSDFAQEITTAGANLTNRTMFRSEEPLLTHQQISQLMEIAQAIDPDNKQARHLQLRLACYQMDFAEAAELLPSVRERVPPNQAWIIHRFRHFTFDRQSRPSKEQLLTFLDIVGQTTNEPAAFIESMFVYDLAARDDKAIYGSVMRNFLNFFNEDWDPDGYLHDPISRTLTLRFDPSFRFGTWHQGHWPVLRLLDLHSLRLECSQDTDLVGLDGLSIESLDLSSCAFKPTRPITFPGLNELHIMSGQFDLEELRAMVISDKTLKIIEHSDPQ